MKLHSHITVFKWVCNGFVFCMCGYFDENIIKPLLCICYVIYLYLMNLKSKIGKVLNLAYCVLESIKTG